MLFSACYSISAVSCERSVISWRTMEKRKRRSPNSEELERRYEETTRLLEQRITYHRRLIAEEKARRQLPWYRRIFAA